MTGRCRLSSQATELLINGSRKPFSFAQSVVEFTTPYIPAQSIEVKVLGVDGNALAHIDTSDLRRSLRQTAEKTSRALQHFWLSSRLDDQSLVIAAQSQFKPDIATNNTLRHLLDKTFSVLEPVRRFLRIAPLYFDDRTIPNVERVSMYRHLAPLQLIDAIAVGRGIPFPFDLEIASCLGNTYSKSVFPENKTCSNYVILPTPGHNLLNTEHLLALPKRQAESTASIGVTYKFRTRGVLRIRVNGTPFYFSRIPEKFFTERYHIKATRAIRGGQLAPSWEDNPTNVNSIALGHNMEPAILKEDTAQIQISAIWLNPATILDNNVVWNCWLSLHPSR